MEALYLYIAFSYLFMVSVLYVRWSTEVDKVGLVCAVISAPITMPAVLVLIISNKL